MTDRLYLRRLEEARLAAVSHVLVRVGHEELEARQLAHCILDAQVMAEVTVLEMDRNTAA